MVFIDLGVKNGGVIAYSRLKKRVLLALFLYLIAILSSISVLIIFEHWPLIDSIYMSILTLTTVGYGEVRPLSQTGRLIMSGVMLIDNAIFLYAMGSLVTFIVEGHIKGIFRENTFMKKIDKYKNHYIIVGYGRLGRQAAKTLINLNKQVVGIDVQEGEGEVWEHEGTLILSGDGREESVLKKAGIERAVGLSACLPDEADNLVVILTAKEYNPHLQIVARASTYGYIQRLSRVGAHQVIVPEMAAGKQMAFDLVDPAKRKIARLMELAITSGFQLEEVKLTANSPLIGKSILEARIRQEWDVFIPFVAREGKDYEPHPDPNRVFQQNDLIWLFGSPENIKKFIREAT